MNLTIFFFGLITLFYFTGCKNNDQAVRPDVQDKPNLVLIVSDDHGRDDAGFLGNDVIHTPNLDALAAEGTVFNNAYCTSASCAASRSVILSGLQNHANGIFGHTHHVHHFSAYDSIQSLPSMLSEFGYRTGRVGKYHLAPENVYKFQHTFEANLRNPVEMTHAVESFIKDKSDQPYFLYFCTSDPHRSRLDTTLKYNPDLFGNKEGGYEGVEEITFAPEEVIVPPYLPDTPEARAELAQYYQSVARLDQGVGTLIKTIKESGEWDNTVVMYISDNGIAFPGAKTNQYDPAIHLPCIVRNPLIDNAPDETNAMISWVDITPTFLDFAGLYHEAQQVLTDTDGSKPWAENWSPDIDAFHGKSFKEVLAGTYDEKNWSEIFTSHTFHEITMYYPMRVVQNQQYKLIWNVAHRLKYPHASDLYKSATWQSVKDDPSVNYAGREIKDYNFRAEFELYDMVNDPDELINLAYTEQYAEILASLKERMKFHQKRTSDPWIVKWKHE